LRGIICSMKRLLVFSTSDWHLPGSSPEGIYLREVFSRLAAHGHRVALVTVRPFAWSIPFWPGRRPGVEHADGVQVLRLGWKPLYRFMTVLLLSRMVRNGRLAEQFDVLIECVQGRPLMVARHIEDAVGAVPDVLPLVFGVRRGMAADPDPPGPILAASAKVRDSLVEMGVPARAIVTVPPGDNGHETGETGDGWDRAAALVMATIDNL
jgi:hypothetical protein